MKKKSKISDAPRREYDESLIRSGVRGKYAERYRASKNVVFLAPDVAATFPNADAVNDALRKVIKSRLRREAKSANGIGGKRAKQADMVRDYCKREYIERARARGQTTVRIRAGDVQTALGLKDRIPLICSALGANIFEESLGLERISIEGPLNGSNTTFIFRLN
jgi:hypothetical protein